jgi:hypothetical protein
MYHQYLHNVRKTTDIQHEITELNDEYKRHFGKDIVAYEILDSQRSNRKPNLVVRMKPNHFIMNQERLFYCSEPYTVYYELPFGMAKGIVETIKMIQSMKIDAVKHACFDTNIGKYTFTMTGGVQSYKIYNSEETNDIAVWFKKGW